MVKDENTPLRIVELEETNSAPSFEEDYSELMEEFGLNQNKAQASWLCFGGCARNCVFLLLNIMDPDLHSSTRILGANTDTQQFSEMFRPGTPKPKYLSKWAKLTKENRFRILPLGNEGGAGRNPEVAQAAVESAGAEIRKSFDGSRISILVANLGGGTGSGAAPVVAQHLGEQKDSMGSIAVLMNPFGYEGEVAFKRAEEAIRGVTAHIPALIIRNQALYEIRAEDSRYKKLVQDLEGADTGKAIDIANEYGLAPIIYALDRLIMHAASSVNRDPRDFMRLMQAGKSVYIGIYRSDEEGAPTEKEKIVEHLLNNPFLAKGIIERAKIGMILFEGFLHEDTGYIAAEIIEAMKGESEKKSVELIPGHDKGEPGKRAIFFMAVAEEEPDFATLINPSITPKKKRHFTLPGFNSRRTEEETAAGTPSEQLVFTPLCVKSLSTRELAAVERNLPLELSEKIKSFSKEHKESPAALRTQEWNALCREAKPYLHNDEEMAELQLLTFQNENQVKVVHYPLTPLLYHRYKTLERRCSIRAANDSREEAWAEFESVSQAFKEETGNGLHLHTSYIFKEAFSEKNENKRSGWASLLRR